MSKSTVLSHDLGRIERITGVFDGAFREIDRDFPNHCCVFAAKSLCYALDGAFKYSPEWSFRVIVGTYDNHGHCWVSATHNVAHFIVDPTVGQFDGGQAWGIFPVDSRQFQRYRRSPFAPVREAIKPVASGMSTHD